MSTDFDLTSGTTVRVYDNCVVVERNSGKAAAKALFAGRTMGTMSIKKSAITKMIFYADFLMICASGLPAPTDFKIGSIADVKQYPNCIVAKKASSSRSTSSSPRACRPLQVRGRGVTSDSGDR